MHALLVTLLVEIQSVKSSLIHWCLPPNQGPESMELVMKVKEEEEDGYEEYGVGVLTSSGGETG